MMKKQSRQQLVGLAILFLFALASRFAFIGFFGSEDRRYDALYDDTIYTDIATQLAAGNGFVLSHDHFVADAGELTSIVMPLYPYFLAAIFSVFGPSYLPVKLLHAFVGAATVLVVYFIAMHCFDRSVARLAAIIAASYPLFIMYTRPLMTETLFVFLVSINVLLALKLVSKPSAPIAVAWGIVAGLAVLTRSEMLVYLAVMGGFVAWRLWRQNGFLHTVGYGALTLLVCIACMGPWLIRNWNVHGALVLENKQWGLWEANMLRFQREQAPETVTALPERDVIGAAWDAMSELERDRVLGQLGTSFIQEHPRVYVRYGLTRLAVGYPFIPRELLAPPLGYSELDVHYDDSLPFDYLDEFPRYLRWPEMVRVWFFRLAFVLAVGGILMALRRNLPGGWWLLALLIGAQILVSLVFHGQERLRMSIDPYMIILAAFALQSIYIYLRKTAQEHDLQEPRATNAAF